MLDIVYYPVSAVLRLWHTAFAAVLGPADALAWILAVVFLVATFRAVLFPPFLRQARNQAAMKRLQPEVRAIQRKFDGDKQRISRRPLSDGAPPVGTGVIGARWRFRR